MPGNTTASIICQRYGTLKSKRHNWEWLWDECLRYCMPEEDMAAYKSWYGGEKEKPYDISGIRAAKLLGGALFSYTISRGEDWFSFRTTDKELSKDDSVQQWLSDASNILLEYLQNSPFASASQEMLMKYPVLGTGCTYCELQGKSLYFREYSVVDICVSSNSKKEVDTVFREFEFTAQQAVDKWGLENVSKEVREAFQKDPYKITKYVHAVFPEALDPERDPKAGLDPDAPPVRPYSSYYIDIDNEAVMERGGYSSFPYAVSRWSLIGEEDYGRGPAMESLFALRMLSRATVDYIDSVEMSTFPPVFVPNNDTIDIKKMQAGEVIPLDLRDGTPVFYQSNTNFSMLMDFLNRHQSHVDDLFHVKQLLSLTPASEIKRDVTATEVDQRAREGLQSISPAITRLEEEHFGPTITRAFGLLLEAGIIPPPPDVMVLRAAERGMDGLPVDIVYTTELDRRLAQTRIASLLEAIQQMTFISQSMQQAPDAGLHLNPSKIYRQILRANNVLEGTIRSEEEVKQMIEDIRKQEAALQQQQAAQGLVSELAKGTDTQKAPQQGSLASEIAG